MSEYYLKIFYHSPRAFEIFVKWINDDKRSGSAMNIAMENNGNWIKVWYPMVNNNDQLQHIECTTRFFN